MFLFVVPWEDWRRVVKASIRPDQHHWCKLLTLPAPPEILASADLCRDMGTGLPGGKLAAKTISLWADYI